MSDNVVDLSEARQKRRFPELKLVSSNETIAERWREFNAWSPRAHDAILEQARRFARIIADLPSDSESPEPA